MKTQGQNVWVVWLWLMLCSVGVWAGQIVSPTMKYTLMTGVNARGIVYDARADRLYAMVMQPGQQVMIPYIAVINPYIGEVEGMFRIEGTPVLSMDLYKLVLSDDGHYLYFVHGVGTIIRIDMTTQQVDLQIQMPGREDQASNGVAYDIVVLPGQPRAVAVVHAVYNTSSGMKWAWKVRIYDDDVMRPTEAMVPMETTQFSYGAQIVPTPEPSVLCLYDQAGGLRRIAVDGSGASLIETIATGWGQVTMKDLKQSGGMVLGVPSNGVTGYVYDLEARKSYYQRQLSGTPMELDRSLNGVYTASSTGLAEYSLFGGPDRQISYYLDLTGALSWSFGVPLEMVRFGAYGLAMRMDGNRIILGQRNVGPVLYYKMDETDGATVKNSGVMQTGNVYDGFLSGHPLQPWVAGRWGNALNLENKNLVQSSYPGVGHITSRTCAAWIKTTDADGGSIISWGLTGSNGGLWSFRVGATGKILLDVQGGLVRGSTIVNDGKWHHVAAVLPISEAPKVSHIRLYVDGVLEMPDMITNPDLLISTVGGDMFVVGGNSSQVGSYYTGLLDEVRVYDVALEEEELWRLIWPVPALPAAYWTMDEPSGTGVRDCAGGHDGTLVNATDEVRMAGRNGNGLVLDGVDDYVTVPGYKGVTGKASRTCTAWIKTTRTNGQIIGWGALETGKKWVIRLDEVGTYTWEWEKAVVLRAEVQNGWIVGTTPLNDGQWHHVAVVLDNDGTPNVSEVRLYVDGVRDTVGGVQACAIDTAVGQDVGIGGFIPLPQYFGGFLDDVRVYDIALDDTAISALHGSIDKYMTMQPTDPMRDEPLAHWAMDETAGVNAADSLGRYPGKLVNNDGSGAWVGGAAGGALMLDGVDDYVTIPGFKGVTGLRSRSSMAWIKTTQVGGHILSWGNKATGRKWIMRVNENGTLRAEVEGGYVYGRRVVADGQWHHVAAVLDSSGSPTVMNIRLYVDGVLDEVGAMATNSIDTDSGNDVAIGVFLPQPQYFAGLVDEVRIYDYAVNGVVAAKQVVPHVVDEPSAYWTMDEASGEKIADSLGGHTGYLLNSEGAIRADGVSGQSLVLDGVDDYVTVPGYKGVTGKGSRSCMAWIKTTRAAGQIVSWGSYETGRKWVMRVNENGTLRVEVQGGYIYGTSPVNDGQWHHVAAVLDSDGTPDVSEVRLYVDGYLQAAGGVQACGIDTAVGQDAAIGSFSPLPQFFSGLVDEVRVYDYALTSAAITVQMGASVTVELEAYWKLDEQSGLTVADSAGGHDGQINYDQGNPWVMGKSGNALQLDGWNDSMTVPGYKGITGKASRTCTAWVKTTKTGGQILSWGSKETGRKWIVRVNENGTLRAEVESGYVFGTTLINDGQWHHIAAVLDNDGTPNVSEVRLYVDGYRDMLSSKGVQACAIDTAAGQDVRLGAFAPQAVYYSGMLDEVRIYRGALTDAEVMDVMRSAGVVETKVDAGPDQTVYADADGTAEVVLDGGGSVGEDIVAYIWQVAGLTLIDGQPAVVVRLPVGVYTAGLAVSDGIMVSQPDEAVIRVVRKQAGVLTMVPTAIRRSDASRYVTAMLKLPAGVAKLDTRLRLSPGDAAAVFEQRAVSGGDAFVVGWFDKQALLNAAAEGPVEVTVSGELADGTLVYGKAMVKVGP
jgi:hypothetical protein